MWARHRVRMLRGGVPAGHGDLMPKERLYVYVSVCVPLSLCLFVFTHGTFMCASIHVWRWSLRLRWPWPWLVEDFIRSKKSLIYVDLKSRYWQIMYKMLNVVEIVFNKYK